VIRLKEDWDVSLCSLVNR